MRTPKPLLPFLVDLLVIITFAAPTLSQNAVPLLINYQGDLRSPTTGEPVSDGSYDMAFRVYDVESGGAALWEGTHTAANSNPVVVANGIFSVILGSGTGNALDSPIFNGPDRWLEIEVGGETLSPRQRTTSTAFSIVSENSRLLNGRDASDFADAAHRHVGDDIVSLPWGKLTDVPPGFADGEDNDTTYTAGAGLMLLDSQFNVVFDGSGAANTASRSDHNHNGVYALQAHEHDAADIVSGVLPAARFSAYDDLISEGHLDNIDDPDLMTLGDAKARFWSVYGNTGTNPASHFVGTLDEQSLELRVNGERALRLEPGASPNVIGGYMLNGVTDGVIGATVSGGGESGLENRVSDSFGTVGGGRNNHAGDDAGTVNDKPGATVGGGAWNVASGRGATVGGGLGNQVTADFATIAGGGRVDPSNPLLGNFVFDHYGSIGGGGNNRAGSDDGDPTNAAYATVGGGGTNWATGQGATVGGGFVNEANGFAATISGGDSNIASGDYATVGGGWYNQADAQFATIAGGGPSNPADPSTGNLVTDDYGTIGGGAHNQAGNNEGTVTDASYTTVSGGELNTASDWHATVSGGYKNTASGADSTISGGNSNETGDHWATVGGGCSNKASGQSATVGGGGFNTVSDYGATVGGGTWNTASGRFSTVPGGHWAEARCYGEHAYASGSFSPSLPGSAQTSVYVVRKETLSPALTELFLNLYSERITIPVGSTWVFEAQVVGRTQDSGEFSNAYSAGFRIRGVIQNAGGSTTMPGATGDVLYRHDPSWNAIAEADDTNDALVIKVKGGSDYMRWVATVRTTEVMFPQPE